MEDFSYIFSLFIGLVVTSLPFLLLGIFLSSTLLLFINDVVLWSKLPRNRLLGAILGSSLGLIIPVGQYGHLPLTRRLLLKGVSLPIAISFLVASPTVNIWVIGLSLSLFKHQTHLIWLRVIISWLLGVLMGLLFSFYSPHSESKPILTPFSLLLKSGSFLKNIDVEPPLHRLGNIHYSSASPSLSLLSSFQKLQLWFKNTYLELRELGSVLVWGCAIAAILQFYLSPRAFINPAQSAELQLISLYGLSFWTSAGSFLGTAVIRAFSGQVLSTSILAFLLLSAFVDLKGISLMIVTFRLKMVLVLLLLLSQFVFLIILLLNFLISTYL